MILWVSNEIDCVATLYIYKLCDICDCKGGTFRYGLTKFEALVATLIIYLRLGRGLRGFEREEEGCSRGRGIHLP